MWRCAATSIGDYALFGGGYSGDRTNVVNAYDENLLMSVQTSLNTATSFLAAASVGDYALFGGGDLVSGYLALVNVYQVL